MADRNEIVDALESFAGSFDAFETVERTPVIDLNAVNPLSQHREVWQNASTTPTEHQLSTTANTDDRANLETVERGQYVPGYEVQGGTGVRVPEEPTGDSELRWGYYTTDSNNDPVDGFYFGVDSAGVFVARARGATIEKVYQSDWNRDTLDGSGNDLTNPSNEELDLTDGNICQVEFTYYGYGPIEMQIFVDEPNINNTDPDAAANVITAHVFDVSGQTSVENTNLPLKQEIVSGGTDNDALDLFVGGRQFSILGFYSTNNRKNGHYRDEMTGIDDTQWYPAISTTAKDGTDIGSTDFRHVITEIFDYEASNDTVPKRFQIRRGTQPTNATWISPSSVEGQIDETALKVDVSATDIQDGSGNVTGTYVDGGPVPSGDNQRRGLVDSGISGKITSEEVLTLSFRAQPGEGTGAVSSLKFNWEERW